jgi:predicted glycosyltransferase
MTKIWFDVLTPKQTLFCNRIAQGLMAEGFEIGYTTREYDEVQGALELLGIKAAVIGRHGGGDRFDKLLASAERVVELARHVKKMKPDVAFAFASPESARVAFGLGIPYFTANDSPHSYFVAKLTIPFAKVLFTPWFMKQAWQELDVPVKKIIPYHGLDPVAWLQDFTPNKKVLDLLGIGYGTDYVVIRPEETQASYLSGKVDEQNPITIPVIERIITEFPNLKIIVLCRYKDQRARMHRRFGNRITIPEKVVDAPSLISTSTLLVGSGGTMNQEACLLGVPVISCYPGNQLEVERFLIKEKLLYRIQDPIKAAEKTEEILRNRQQYHNIHSKRSSKLLAKMENPAKVIASYILKFNMQE